MKDNGKIIFIALPIVVAIILMDSILINNLNLVAYESYQIVYSAFLFFALFIMLLISIGELISLGFDKTATKNTLFATLFLFIFLVSSNDFFFNIALLGASRSEIFNNFYNYINPVIGHICYIGFIYFILKFFNHDYNAVIYSKYIFIALGLSFIAHVCAHIFNIDILLLIVSLTEIIGVMIYFSFLIYKIRKSENFIPAELSYCLVIFFSLAYFFNELHFLKNVCVIGVTSNIYVFISLCYIFIYIHFMISKTKSAYLFEENNKNKVDINSINKMKVTCFNTFDCFINDNLLKFPSKKSKEFFALLVVLNGKSLSMEKAITYLYPDKDIDKAKVSYRDIIWKLRQYFLSINFKGVNFDRGLTTLDKRFIECDYYDKISKKEEIDLEFFLPEYTWSIDFLE